MLRSGSSLLESIASVASIASTPQSIVSQNLSPPRKYSSHWTEANKARGSHNRRNKWLKTTESKKAKEGGSADTQVSSIAGGGTGTVYPAYQLLQEFCSIASDSTGQYVATMVGYVNYIFISQDYGVTYTQTFTPSMYYDNEVFGGIAIASDAPQYMAFAGSTGIYTSTDYGNTFTVVQSTSTIYNWVGIAMSSNGQYTYAICCGGYNTQTAQIYASTDTLTTFNLLPSATTAGYLGIATSSNGQYVFAYTVTSIFGSSDYGNTFSIVFTLGSLNAIACSSTCQYVGMGTEAGSIYISSNYGKSGSWKKSTLPYQYGPEFTGLAFSSNGQKVMAVSDGAPVFTSTNYGSSFQMTNSPAQQFISAAMSSNGNYMYTVSDYGYPYMSSNAGSTWTPLYYNWYGVASSGNGQYRYAATDYFSAIYMSSDNGNKWTSLSSPNSAIPYAEWYSIACNANSCQYVVITSDNNQIAISSNYGKSWKAITLGNPNVTPNDDYSAGYFVVAAVAISATGQYITLVPNSGPIYVSSNYGASFSQASSSVVGAYWCVAMSSNGQLQLAGMISYSFYSNYHDPNYVYISTNSGQTWTTVAGLPASTNWNAVSMDSTGTNMVATSGTAVYYSTNSGNNWNFVKFPYSFSNFVALCQSSNGQIVYIADGSGMFDLNQGSIYVSNDYGATWETTGAPIAEWSQLACDSTGTYLTGTAGAGQVYTSSNAGVTWIPQNITVVSTTYGPTTSSSSSSDSLSGGAVAGIVIGTLIGVALIGFAVALFVFGVSVPCFGKKNAPLLANQA